MASETALSDARLEQFRKNRRREAASANARLIGIAGFLVAAFNGLALQSISGLYGDMNFIPAVIGAGLTWLAFFRFSEVESAFRFLLDFFVVVATLFFLRVCFDILWGTPEAIYEYNKPLGDVVGHVLVVVGGASLAMLAGISIVLAVRRAMAVGEEA